MLNVRSLGASVLMAALLLTGAAARAEGAPSVTVLPYSPLFGSVPQSIADKVTEEISAELGASNSGNDFTVVELVGADKKGAADKKPKEDGVTAAKKPVAAALAQLEKGTALVAGRKFKPAADELEKGINAFLANFQGADDFKALSDAYVQLALARLKLGNDDGAAKALDDLIRLDPERVLASPAVPKQLADQHSKQREALLAKSRGSIRVDSAPAGAKITIDGRDVGETPLLAQAAIPGVHYVRVIKEGMGSAFEKLTVATDMERVTFTLAEEHATGPLASVGKGLSKNSVSDEVLKAVQSIGKASKAEYVVFGAIRKNTATDSLDVKSFGLRTKDGAIALLADLGFDVELLGANIEVLKLVGDLTQKISDQTFAAPPAALAAFDGIAPPRSESPSIIALAPPSAETKASPDSGGGESGVSAVTNGGSRRRGPVKAEEPEAEAPVKATAPAKVEEDTGGSVLEQLQKRRAHRQEEEEETPKAKKSKKKVDADEEETKASTDEDDEDAPKKKVNLKPPKKKARLSGLTPEELDKMKAAEAANTSSGNNTVPIIVGVSVGVVVVAGLVTGGYFLFSPHDAKSATAHFTW